MSDNRPHFGDPLPDPPPDLRVKDSSHLPGQLFFFAVSLGVRILHPRKKRVVSFDAEKIENILLVQMERIGDLVLAEPAVRAVREHFSSAQISMIAPPFARYLFKDLVDKYLPGTDLEIATIRESGFDLVIDLTGRLEYRIARTLADSRIPFRTGLERGGRGVFYTHTIANPPVTVPTREVYLEIVKTVGVQAVDSVPRIVGADNHRQKGKIAWQEKGIESPVVIMPGAYYPSQRWSLEKFALTGKLLKNDRFQVVVICGPGEEGMGASLAQEIETPMIAAPPFKELLDLLAGAGMVICNNTGPLHIAAALDTPTVSTMGPTVPWRWWPVSHAPVVVFRGGATGEVGNLEAIDPQEVVIAVKEVIG